MDRKKEKKRGREGGIKSKVRVFNEKGGGEREGLKRI